MGLMFQSPPLREEVSSPRTPDYKKALDKVLDKGVRMVVVVIPNNKSDAYAMVKKTCLIQKPTSSQVVTATVLKKWVPKGIQSVATKIAIQMACKLGGEPWTVPIPVKGLMVIGKFYSCNNITTTLIQISRRFYFGFFSKTNHQMII